MLLTPSRLGDSFVSELLGLLGKCCMSKMFVFDSLYFIRIFIGERHGKLLPKKCQEHEKQSGLT